MAERDRPNRRRPRAVRLRRAALALGVVAALVGAVVVVVPAARAAAKAPLVLAGAVGAPVPDLLTASVERRRDDVAGVPVDRYSPGAGAPPVLVVPGAAPAGRDDDRVVSLATALAGAGREVVVPELSLYEQELDREDVDRVVRVAASLCPAEGDLVLLGFSFGGSLALVAAADDRVASCVELVATFGAYGDLVGVLQAAGTGVSVVDGERYPWRVADASLVRRVLEDTATELLPPARREQFRRALQARDSTGLAPDERVLYALLTTDDPERVRALAERLPPYATEVLRGLSPVEVADDIQARVLAAHAEDDPAVPYAELRRLRRAFPQAQTTTVESFEHVDLELSGDLPTVVADLLSASSFVREVLAAQERWPGG